MTDEEIIRIKKAATSYNDACTFTLVNAMEDELTRLREENAALSDRVRELEGEREKAFKWAYKNACEMFANRGWVDWMDDERRESYKEYLNHD